MSRRGRTGAGHFIAGQAALWALSLFAFAFGAASWQWGFLCGVALMSLVHMLRD